MRYNYVKTRQIQRLCSFLLSFLVCLSIAMRYEWMPNIVKCKTNRWYFLPTKSSAITIASKFKCQNDIEKNLRIDWFGFGFLCAFDLWTWHTFFASFSMYQTICWHSMLLILLYRLNHWYYDRQTCEQTKLQWIREQKSNEYKLM